MPKIQKIHDHVPATDHARGNLTITFARGRGAPLKYKRMRKGGERVISMQTFAHNSFI